MKWVITKTNSVRNVLFLAFLSKLSVTTQVQYADKLVKNWEHLHLNEVTKKLILLDS